MTTQGDGAAEYQQVVTDLNDLYRQGIRAFAKWVGENWQVSRDEWVKSYDSPPPSAEYIKGFNAGVEAVDAAADAFLDDYHQ